MSPDTSITASASPKGHVCTNLFTWELPRLHSVPKTWRWAAMYIHKLPWVVSKNTTSCNLTVKILHELRGVSVSFVQCFRFSDNLKGWKTINQRSGPTDCGVDKTDPYYARSRFIPSFVQGRTASGFRLQLWTLKFDTGTLVSDDFKTPFQQNIYQAGSISPCHFRNQKSKNTTKKYDIKWYKHNTSLRNFTS